ncbi:MAG TPA: hypothetical protein VJQ56_07970, partial [Blastocatellia bacterium]|nr:hypothetical protein [Blastocatellia bacterium]
MRNVRPRFVTSKVIDSKTVVIIALAITLALSLPGQRVFAHGTQKYVNGRWFNGQTFELKTVYVVDGAFRMEYDGKADSTIDLQGKFVIPPLAEAHNHHFGEEANYKQQLRTYLQQGIFYSKNTNNIAKLAVPVRRLVNNPESVDVVYANGGLTSRGGHPAQIYDMFAQHLPGWSPKDMEDQAYFI